MSIGCLLSSGERVIILCRDVSSSSRFPLIQKAGRAKSEALPEKRTQNENKLLIDDGHSSYGFSSGARSRSTTGMPVDDVELEIGSAGCTEVGNGDEL